MPWRPSYRNRCSRHTQRGNGGASARRVDHAVTAQVPVVVGRDDRYFSDPYQGIPADGYTALFERLLDHPVINVDLRHYYDPQASRIRPHRLFYPGCIDTYFGCVLGRLPYRSVRIEFDELPLPQFQRTAVVNHLDDCPFTRTTEYKHFGAVENPSTVVSTEYPMDFEPGENEPCYPVPTAASRALFLQYAKCASRLQRIFFLGRMGDYRYYNMDQAVGRALALGASIRAAPCWA